MLWKLLSNLPQLLTAVRSSINLKIFPNPLALPISLFYYLINPLVLIIVKKGIRKNWSNIQFDEKSDYLLKYFIPMFKETIT